jgi:serine/threonine-protein kinase
MGTVYRARHVDTGDHAAVKALAANLAATEGFRERFEAEIESLKLLKHPGIVRLLGYGEEGGILFYAMELVEGTSLEEELRVGRRFTWLEVLDYGIQICRALKHAHDHGVIHRDIKPANILIDREGCIKIADFGIARLFGSTQLTSAGGVLGTADYMSPEQTDGRNITEKADQYSLGGVMYALLAGRPPFRAKSLPEMLQLQRFAEPEPVRRYAPETPEQLERLIAQLLSKDPAARFPNAMVLARHMEAMRRALSRPAADDFALSVESPQDAPAGDAPYEAVAMDTTRIEPGVASQERVEEPRDEAAQRTVRSSPGSADHATERGTASTGPLSGWTDDGSEVELEVEELDRVSARGVNTTSTPPAKSQSLATRFRTVDQDLRETQREDRPSRLVLILQVLGILATIGLLSAAAWYFSRPATADDLFAQIDPIAEQGKIEALRAVEGPIDEFLARFPNDPRAAAVAGYKEEIELSRLDDRLNRRARRRLGGEALAPIEQMYLDAIRKADSNPSAAIEELRSILILYDADHELPVPDSSQADVADPDSEKADADVPDAEELNRRVQHCLRLIERRLARLTSYTQMEAANQLPVLFRRLAEARELESTNPVRARAIYLAILNLCEGKRWAQEAVAEAVAALKAMDAPSAQPARDATIGAASGE